MAFHLTNITLVFISFKKNKKGTFYNIIIIINTSSSFSSSSFPFSKYHKNKKILKYLKWQQRTTTKCFKIKQHPRNKKEKKKQQNLNYQSMYSSVAWEYYTLVHLFTNKMHTTCNYMTPRTHPNAQHAATHVRIYASHEILI